MPEGVEVKYYKNIVETSHGVKYEYIFPIIKSPVITAQLDSMSDNIVYDYDNKWGALDAVPSIFGVDTTRIKFPMLVNITKYPSTQSQETASAFYSKFYEYFPNIEKITDIDSFVDDNRYLERFKVFPAASLMTFTPSDIYSVADGSQTMISMDADGNQIIRLVLYAIFGGGSYEFRFFMVPDFENIEKAYLCNVNVVTGTSKSRITIYRGNNTLGKLINTQISGSEEVQPGPGPGPEPGGGDDPYNPGGTSGSGGGQGSFDPSGDDVTIPALPTLSALSTGFISLFTPTIAELQNLANYMWNNDLFSLDTWKKIFANPMDAILGLSIVPVAVPSAGQVPVTVGNISTGVSMTKASAQYVTVDCGSVTISEYWGAYLDYDPYTKMELYLPYIGIVPVKADDVIGKQIHIAYHVDILSGACCAMVQCGNSILYTYNGSCAMQIPVSGVDMTTAISSVISATASVAAMLATGGAGSLLGGAITAGAITNTANSVMNAKPTVQHSGSMTGPGGQLGVQTPYFIVTRPRQCVAENQNNLVGLPAFFTVNLGEVSGYTEVEDIHLTGIPATSDELEEIAQLLKGGVIF